MFAMVVGVDRPWCAAEYVNVVETELATLPQGINGVIVFRDNDPKGFASNIGKNAEIDNDVPVVSLPRRSPNVMPLDYTFHRSIGQHLKNETLDWPVHKSETPEEFTERLLRAYGSLSEEMVLKGCAGMTKRLKSMHEVNGAETAIN